MIISDAIPDVFSGHIEQTGAARDVTVLTLRDRAGFAALRADWDQLFQAVPGQPYADHAYLAAWLDSFGAGRRIAIRIVRSRGRLVGVLPLCKGPGPGAWVPVAQGRAGLVGPMLHPDLSSPLEVLGALLRCGYGQYHLFEPVEAADAARIAEAADRVGLAVETSQVFTASSVDLTDGAEAWRAGLSRNARRAIVRAAKTLEGTDSRRVTSADGQGAAAGAFLDAARTSWKAAAGSGFAGSAESEAFIHALARTADAGSLHFMGLYAGETPVGGSFASVKGDTLYLNAVEFNETMAQAGPGRFVMCRVIEAAAAMGLKRVDMMRTSALNQSVAGDERPLFRVTVHRPGDPTVLLRKVAGVRRRLMQAGLRGLSPRARFQAQTGGDDAA